MVRAAAAASAIVAIEVALLQLDPGSQLAALVSVVASTVTILAARAARPAEPAADATSADDLVKEQLRSVRRENLREIRSWDARLQWTQRKREKTGVPVPRK